MIYWLIVILPFTALSIFSLFEEDVLLTYLAAIIMFGLLVAHIFIFSTKKYKVFINQPLKYFIWFICFIFIVNLGGIDKPTKFFTQFFNLIIIFLSFITFSNIFNKFNLFRIKKVVNFYVFICFLLSLFSIYQYFASKYGLPAFDYFRNANMYYIARDSFANSGWSGESRVFGVAPEPAFWAAFLMIPISILLPKIMRFKFAYLDLIYFIGINIAFVLTFSRSSWLTYGLVLLLYLSSCRLKLKIHPYLIALLSIILVLLSGLIYFILPSMTGLSYYMRIAGSLTALKMVFLHPFIGIGWGCFQKYFLSYQLLPGFARFWENQMQFNLGFAANLFLRIMSESGLIGFIIFMGIINSIYKNIIKYVSLGTENDGFYQGLLLAFYSILITWFYSEAYNLIYIWFILAIVSVVPNISDREGIDNATRK